MFSISLIVAPISQSITALESNHSPVTVFTQEKTVEQLDETSTSTVASYIKVQAIKHQFNSRLVLAIAEAESNFVYNAQNKHSTASGVFQFLDSTFQRYCIEMYELTDTMKNKNNVKIQTECALEIMTTDEKGIDHWLASKASWGKYVPPKGG